MDVNNLPRVIVRSRVQAEDGTRDLLIVSMAPYHATQMPHRNELLSITSSPGQGRGEGRGRAAYDHCPLSLPPCAQSPAPPPSKLCVPVANLPGQESNWIPSSAADAAMTLDWRDSTENYQRIIVIIVWICLNDGINVRSGIKHCASTASVTIQWHNKISKWSK